MTRAQSMQARVAGVVVLFGTLGALPAGAQTPATSAQREQREQPDARWRAWVGCWAPGSDSRTPIAEDAPVVCVAPGAGSAVELVAVAGGKVVARERVVPNGSRQATERDGCSGWEEAAWSSDNRRVYRKTEHTCANGVTRTTNGVFAIGTGGEWLDVRGVGLGASSGVIAVRYRPAGVPEGLPAELAGGLPAGGASVEERAVAAGALTVGDIVDVAARLDAPVAEALLVERGQPFVLDAKLLTALADAGVPGRITDAMIALSYPKVFAVNRATSGVGRREPGAGDDRVAGRTIPVQVDAFGWSPWGWGGGAFGFSPFNYWNNGLGWGGNRFGWGNGFGWYGNGGQVIVVRQPDGSAAQGGGRVVRGRGYTRGGSDGGASPRAGQSGWSSGGSSGGSSAGSSGGSSGSSSGSSTGRTAKPRGS